MSAPHRGGNPLEEAWAALDEGRAADALLLAGGADEGSGERWALEALARSELGELREAETALRRARELGGDGHPDVLWARAEVDLALWRVSEAHAILRGLADRGRTAPVLERIALCLDLEGRFAEADRIIAEASRLDPELRPLPPRLSTDDFERIVAEAIGKLPEPFRRELETTAVVIDPMPGPDLARAAPAETPPDLLGLFVGRPRLDRSAADSGELPPTIFLFQRNLERLCRDHGELLEEIRVTLYHEIGHALGFDEEGVEGMGLG